MRLARRSGSVHPDLPLTYSVRGFRPDSTFRLTEVGRVRDKDCAAPARSALRGSDGRTVPAPVWQRFATASLDRPCVILGLFAFVYMRGVASQVGLVSSWYPISPKLPRKQFEQNRVLRLVTQLPV